MGLDMYAYKLKAEFAPVAVIDVSVTEGAARAGGFIAPAVAAGWDQMDDETKAGYRKQVDVAVTSAIAAGLFDPQFKYWRKFNALHGFMAELYHSKGGSGDFNCSPLRLVKEDLESLRASSSGLAPVAGFFFGSDAPLESSDVEDILAFCTEAIKAIEDGYAVYYDCWW